MQCWISRYVAGYQELYKQLEKPKKQQLLTDFITKKQIDADNNKDNSTIEQNSTVELDISSDDSAIFNPVPNKRTRLLSSNDE